MRIKKFVLMICVISIIIVIIPLIIGDIADGDTTTTLDSGTVTVSGCEGYYKDGTAFQQVIYSVGLWGQINSPVTVTEIHKKSKCSISNSGNDDTGTDFYDNNEFVENPNYPSILINNSETYYAKTIVLTKDDNNKITLRYYHIGEEKTCKVPPIKVYGLCFDDDDTAGGEPDDAVVILVGCGGTTKNEGITCACTAKILANDINNKESYKQKVKTKFVNCDTINWVE